MSEKIPPIPIKRPTKINSNLLKAKGGLYAKSREFFPFIVVNTFLAYCLYPQVHSAIAFPVASVALSSPFSFETKLEHVCMY